MMFEVFKLVAKWRGWSLRKKGKKQKLFLVLNPRPGLDGPNASGWYRRLRELISLFLMFNSVNYNSYFPVVGQFCF